MSSGSKKRTQIYFFFSLKIPANKPHPGTQTGPLWREIPIYRAFCISLENSIKFPLNKEALRKEHPFNFLRVRPLWKQMPISEPYVTYPSGSPVKEPSQVSFGIPRREMPHS
jgi:hypothetical protein